MQISVIIATRNRKADVLKTLQSVLDNAYADFEVILVDQSENELTKLAVAPLLLDARLRYVYIPTPGVARARNTGIRQSRGELVAMTDDDCETPREWLDEIAAAFAIDDRIGIVMGNILAAEHDRAIGFIQNYVRKQPYLAKSIREKHRVEGVGGCIAVRRTVWDALSGFDEMLGAGTRFYAAEETDFMIRALLNGFYVYETPNVSVTHYGVRTWEESEPLIQNYICGLSAMYVKHFKCGNWSALIPFLHLVWRWAFRQPVVNFEHIPSRLWRFRGFIQGMSRGAMTPVDGVKCQYIERR